MAGFKQLSGLVVPLDAANVDTDAIIPKTIFYKPLLAWVSANTYFTNGVILMWTALNQIQNLS